MNLMSEHIFKERGNIKKVLKEHHSKFSYIPNKDKKFYAIVENKHNNKEQIIDVEASDRFQAELYFEDFCNVHGLKYNPTKVYLYVNN